MLSTRVALSFFKIASLRLGISVSTQSLDSLTLEAIYFRIKSTRVFIFFSQCYNLSTLMNEKTKKALTRLHKKLALKQNECSFVEFLEKNPSILKYSSKAKAKRYFMSMAKYSGDLNILFKATYQDALIQESSFGESILLKHIKKNR